MWDTRLGQRLERLENILGQTVSFREPPPEDEEVQEVAKPEFDVIAATSPKKQRQSLPDRTKHTDTKTQRPETKTSDDSADPSPFDSCHFVIDESPGPEVEFCSWKHVVLYPDRYIGKANKPRAKPFFDKILEGRVWDFFYLHDPLAAKSRAYLLVPSTQFQAFLTVINKSLGINLTIPNGVNQEKFLMRFGQGGTPRPRYLKRLRDEKKLDIGSFPLVRDADISAFREASPLLQQDFSDKLKILDGASTTDKKKQKSVDRRARLMNACTRMVSDAQFLLRLKGDKNPPDVVFIAFDVEAIERPPNPISEIGFAILDSKDIQTVPSGPCGRDWWPMIKAHHLRTREYSGLRNREFVKGCPNDFDFGTSTFPAQAELRDAIMAIFQPYVDASRNIVIVGHDLSQDLHYFATLGIDLSRLDRLVGQLDSQNMHRGWRQSSSGRSLEATLRDLHIPNKHLHNAGNDAVYTLRAVIGVAIEQIREEEALERGEEHVPALWLA